MNRATLLIQQLKRGLSWLKLGGAVLSALGRHLGGLVKDIELLITDLEAANGEEDTGRPQP